MAFAIGPSTRLPKLGGLFFVDPSRLLRDSPTGCASYSGVHIERNAAWVRGVKRLMAKFYRFGHESGLVYFKVEGNDVFSWVADGASEPMWVEVAPTVRPNLESFELVFEGSEYEFAEQLKSRSDGSYA